MQLTTHGTTKKLKLLVQERRALEKPRDVLGGLEGAAALIDWNLLSAEAGKGEKALQAVLLELDGKGAAG